MSWRTDRAGFDRRFPLVDNAIGNFVMTVKQHVARTQRLIVIVNDRDGVLGSGHWRTRQDLQDEQDLYKNQIQKILLILSTMFGIDQSGKEVFEERTVDFAALRMVLDPEPKGIIAEPDLFDDVVGCAPGLDFQTGP